MKIYIDTNIYVDFYQSVNDRIGAFDELAIRSDILVSTRQTVNEFSRNRAKVISKAIEEFRKSVKLMPYTTSLIRHLPEFSAVTESKDALRAAADSLVAALDQLIEDTSADPVFQRFHDLISRISVIETTPSIFEMAHRRKLLGEPPSSDTKDTIGDEVIWESLLHSIRDDLAIVTRDKSFHENQLFLQNEFRSKTGKKLLLVTKEINEALRLAGRPASPKLDPAPDPVPSSPLTRFQESNRESAAKGNLLALYVRQESFRAEHDRYGTQQEIQFMPTGSSDWDYLIEVAGHAAFTARAVPKKPSIASFSVDETGKVRRTGANPEVKSH